MISSSFGQTKFSINTTAIFGLSNNQFEAFGDWALRVEHKLNPAFGLFGDVSLKRILGDSQRGISFEAGLHYYKKPSSYWELGVGVHYFQSLSQQSSLTNQNILLTSNEVRPFLTYVTFYQHHQILKIIDFKYGIEYGYRLRTREGLSEPIVNELENPTVYLGFGVGVLLYQSRKKAPYEN